MVGKLLYKRMFYYLFTPVKNVISIQKHNNYLISPGMVIAVEIYLVNLKV